MKNLMSYPSWLREVPGGQGLQLRVTVRWEKESPQPMKGMSVISKKLKSLDLKYNILQHKKQGKRFQLFINCNIFWNYFIIIRFTEVKRIPKYINYLLHLLLSEFTSLSFQITQ